MHPITAPVIPNAPVGVIPFGSRKPPAKIKSRPVGDLRRYIGQNIISLVTVVTPGDYTGLVLITDGGIKLGFLVAALEVNVMFLLNGIVPEKLLRPVHIRVTIPPTSPLTVRWLVRIVRVRIGAVYISADSVHLFRSEYRPQPCILLCLIKNRRVG